MSEDQLRAELAALTRSRSWRITAPLRALSSMVQTLRSPRRMVDVLLRQARQHSFSRQIGTRLMARYPRLQRFIVRLEATSDNSFVSSAANIPMSAPMSTPMSTQIGASSMPPAIDTPNITTQGAVQVTEAGFTRLGRQARRMYAALQAARLQPR